MRPRDRPTAAVIDTALAHFHSTRRALPGIAAPIPRAVFLEQFLESVHRVQFIARGVLQTREIAAARIDPTSELFDPIKGAALHIRRGNHDEACWLVFLFTHFGKNLRTGYRLARDIYGSLGNGPIWDWTRISADPEAFRAWLTENRHTLEHDGVARHFGNHRKYLTLSPTYRGGTGQAVVTYVNWIAPFRSHFGLFDDARRACAGEARQMFGYLYDSMGAVASFGRTGRFDYLTMIAKLQLAPIEPGSPYLTNATGPLEGAKLLFGNPALAATKREIEQWTIELGESLNIEMAMQVLEDSLCNWQKSPNRFIPFRG